MIILTTLEEKKKYVQQFNVFDDAFFEMVAKDKEALIPIHDGEHIIYANASKDVDVESEDDDVAELMEFFNNSQGRNDKFRRLTNRVDDIKNNESEVNTMCKLVEDFAKEYAKEYAKDLIFDLVRTGALSAEIGAEKLNLSLKDFCDLLNGTEQEISNPA